MKRARVPSLIARVVFATLHFNQTQQDAQTVFKRTAILVAVTLHLFAVSAFAADLKLTDSSGTTVVVTGASIDYGGFVASDIETQGIRVLQGDGTVTVKWTDVESITVTGADQSAKPPRVRLEILLKGGKKVPAALARQGRMKLRGKTELGEYSIDLDKVRVIVPGS